MLAGLPVYATAFLILFARVGAVLMLLPVFSEDSIAPRARLLMAGGMTLGLWALLAHKVMPLATRGDAELAGIVVSELLVGLSLGLSVRLLFMAISIAGSLISLQTGLSSAVIFDPAQSGHAPLISRFVGIAAAVVCMSLAVHHLWLGAIVRSYDLFPVGTWIDTGDFAQLAIRVASESLSLGLALAAPLIVYGIVFNVLLGMIARVAPAIQIFFIAQPLNLILGFAVATAVFGTMLLMFADAMAEWMRTGWS